MKPFITDTKGYLPEQQEKHFTEAALLQTEETKKTCGKCKSCKWGHLPNPEHVERSMNRCPSLKTLEFPKS